MMPDLANLSSSKVLITGGNGRLARCLKKAFEFKGAKVWAPARSEMDLLHDDALNSILDFRPDWLLHPAGMTNVDRCEVDSDGAFAANRGTTAVLTQAANMLGCGGIYISTDYVFGDAGKAPFPEDARPSPMNVYGQSKAEAEDVALKGGLAVVRVSWLFGDGQGFEAFVLKAALAGNVPLARQRGTPTHLTALSQCIVSLTFSAEGVYHLVGEESVSRKEWAELILLKAGLSPKLSVRDDLFVGKAPRPEDSSLINTRGGGVTIPGVSKYY